MNKRSIIGIPATILLVVLAAAPLLFYFSGCVAIPDQAVVVSGRLGQELDRQAASCESDFGFAVPMQADGGIDPEQFSLLSWNSHRGSHQNWHNDLVSLARGADIILLQEAALKPVLEAQPDLSANQWLMAAAFYLEDQEIGVMSAARVPAEAYCVNREPEPILQIPKVGLAAAYPLAGLDQELLVVNIHMVNFTIKTEAIQRQIGALERLVRTHRGPVIVAGDFNTWNEEREALVHRKMTDLGMRPVAFDPDHRASFFKHKVDAVYYRNLEVTKSLSHQVESSDHTPLEVHFRLSRRAAGS